MDKPSDLYSIGEGIVFNDQSNKEIRFLLEQEILLDGTIIIVQVLCVYVRANNNLFTGTISTYILHYKYA